MEFVCPLFCCGLHRPDMAIAPFHFLRSALRSTICVAFLDWFCQVAKPVRFCTCERRGRCLSCWLKLEKGEYWS